jgi:hypothetical protein
MVEAFNRCMINPLKSDKLCNAKLAIVEALDEFGHQNAQVYP